MAKWEKKIKEVLAKEKEKHDAVYKLLSLLKSEIHGFHPIDKTLLHEKVKGICSKAVLEESEIVSVSVDYRFDDGDENMLLIVIEIKGDFNGSIEITTSSGYRSSTNGKIDIYYIFPSSCKVKSNKNEKIQELYKSYEKCVIEEIIDIAIDGNHYISYSDRHKDYSIWCKRTGHSTDSITGYIDKHHPYQRRVLKNLQKIRVCKDIEEFAENELDGREESYTETWTEYSL